MFEGGVRYTIRLGVFFFFRSFYGLLIVLSGIAILYRGV